MFGREADVAPLLGKMPRLKAVTTLVHTDDVVGAEDKFVVEYRDAAVKQGRKPVRIVTLTTEEMSERVTDDSRRKTFHDATNYDVIHFCLDNLILLHQPTLAYFSIVSDCTTILQ